MSIEAIKQFLTEVSESKELQAEVTTAMEAENYCQAITEIAAKYGYEFTPDEMSSEVEQAFEALNAEELNEAELLSVAGGSAALLRGASEVVEAGFKFTARKRDKFGTVISVLGAGWGVNHLFKS